VSSVIPGQTKAGEHPEQDGADAAQEQQPPILGKGVQQQTRDWGASNVCHDRPLFIEPTTFD
jgi:hypothetical protein